MRSWAVTIKGTKSYAKKLTSKYHDVLPDLLNLFSGLFGDKLFRIGKAVFHIGFQTGALLPAGAYPAR